MNWTFYRESVPNSQTTRFDKTDRFSDISTRQKVKLLKNIYLYHFNFVFLFQLHVFTIASLWDKTLENEEQY